MACQIFGRDDIGIYLLIETSKVQDERKTSACRWRVDMCIHRCCLKRRKLVSRNRVRGIPPIAVLHDGVELGECLGCCLVDVVCKAHLSRCSRSSRWIPGVDLNGSAVQVRGEDALEVPCRLPGARSVEPE